MRPIAQYHRPADIDEAVNLLNRPGVNSVVVAGGTGLTAAELPADTEVVDIQTAVPSGLEVDGEHLVMGAMTTLQDMVDSNLAPELIRDLAKREASSTFRHAVTVGGIVGAADWESGLLAGLLVHQAQLTIATPDGTRSTPLDDALAAPHPGTMITSVSIEVSGEGAFAATGRTPADTPIVAAAGRVVAGGFRIALTGVAITPILIDPDDLTSLDPPGDFRGSPEYRRSLAATLTGRVITRLGGA